MGRTREKMNLDDRRPWMIAEVPEPSVLMDSRPFRSVSRTEEVRQFFGDHAAILDALDPEGWANRDLFAKGLVQSCEEKFLKITYPPGAGNDGVECYFARDKQAVEEALERTAERFEEKMLQYLSTMCKGIPYLRQQAGRRPQ